MDVFKLFIIWLSILMLAVCWLIEPLIIIFFAVFPIIPIVLVAIGHASRRHRTRRTTSRNMLRFLHSNLESLFMNPLNVVPNKAATKKGYYIILCCLKVSLLRHYTRPIFQPKISKNVVLHFFKKIPSHSKLL